MPRTGSPLLVAPSECLRLASSFSRSSEHRSRCVTLAINFGPMLSRKLCSAHFCPEAVPLSRDPWQRPPTLLTGFDDGSLFHDNCSCPFEGPQG